MLIPTGSPLVALTPSLTPLAPNCKPRLVADEIIGSNPCNSGKIGGKPSTALPIVSRFSIPILLRGMYVPCSIMFLSVSSAFAPVTIPLPIAYGKPPINDNIPVPRVVAGSTTPET